MTTEIIDDIGTWVIAAIVVWHGAKLAIYAFSEGKLK